MSFLSIGVYYLCASLLRCITVKFQSVLHDNFTFLSFSPTSLSLFLCSLPPPSLPLFPPLSPLLSLSPAPVEMLSLLYDIPWMLVVDDFRQGLLISSLFLFWIVFVGEHTVVRRKKGPWCVGTDVPGRPLANEVSWG